MLGLSRVITRARVVVQKSAKFSFSNWKVGDVVPVSFLKDQAAPVIKEDSEYPSWVSQLSEPLPTKAQLLAKYNDPKIDNITLTTGEIMRLKRLITLTQIKDANLLSAAK
jgi:hypothetical protein